MRYFYYFLILLSISSMVMVYLGLATPTVFESYALSILIIINSLRELVE